MSEESELVKAILELKQESNPVKDYIYPFLITSLAAFLGLFSVKYQKYIDAQKEKLEVANNWVVSFQGAFEGLISIKRTYKGKLSDDPLQRTSAVQEIIHSATKIDLDLGGLSFLVPEKSDTEALEDKWRSLPRINSMKKNYNFLIEVWGKRNLHAAIIIPKIIKVHAENGVADMSYPKIIECVGQEEFLPYMDLTEYAIKMTDDLLIEIYDFVSNFEKSAKECIDIFRVRSYGQILTYKNENAEVKDCLEKSPALDYAHLSQLFNVPEEHLRAKYHTGYEDLVYVEPEVKDPIEENIHNFKERERLKKKHRKWW
ncbi:hypothetical protein [Microbulbifer sp. RZ01]|uniref:hypothetical protein n=1 Tax=Microbulbifer sp. RZ01 TaxID=3021711 RepID=UPI0027E52E0D|nr:hypothetical protein [Microbulbifer sp. RZ01]